MNAKFRRNRYQQLKNKFKNCAIVFKRFFYYSVVKKNIYT